MGLKKVKSIIILTSLALVLISLPVIFAQGHTQLAQVDTLLSAPNSLRTNRSSEMQSLLLNTDTIVVPTNGGHAILTAIVRDVAGQPIVGAEVHFSSRLGSMSPAIVATDLAGVAISTFTAVAVSGQAVITAESNGLIQTALLQINGTQAETASNLLELHLGADVLMSGQQIEVSATLLNAAGHPIAGELVTFFGSLGEIFPASGPSDANGQVKGKFIAGNMSGQATITVISGYASKSGSIRVQTSMVTPTGTPTASKQFSAFLPFVFK